MANQIQYSLFLTLPQEMRDRIYHFYRMAAEEDRHGSGSDFEIPWQVVFEPLHPLCPFLLHNDETQRMLNSITVEVPSQRT